MQDHLIVNFVLLLIQFSMCVHVCYLLYCDYYLWWVGITRVFEQVFFRHLYWYEKQDHISICLGLYYLVCLMCLIGIFISIRFVLTRALCQFHGSLPGLRFGILIFLQSWFSCLMWLIIGPSFKCSDILFMMLLVVQPKYCAPQPGVVHIIKY